MRRQDARRPNEAERADQPLTFKRNMKTCCTPARLKAEPRLGTQHLKAVTRRNAQDAVIIPGGRSFIGTKSAQIPNDGESPVRKSSVTPFLIGATTVTNAEFSAFIQQTGYVTDAEQFGWSFVFWSGVPDEIGHTQAVEGVEWWRKVDGARWDRVDGIAAPIDDHPVVHVSWNDALAYANWVGGRLPTEAEWEHAARGGLGDVRFPWGDQEPNDVSFVPCNIWQGRFPHENSGLDGYLTTAPARSYEPNGYGLYNTAGNVWEWTSDRFRIKSLKKHVKARVASMRDFRLLKGGSFLCHQSYCYRYRIAARSGNSPDSTTSHQGFRVVWETEASTKLRGKD